MSVGDVDHFSCARHMEYLAVNPYHEMQKGLDGEFISYAGDWIRSVKGTNYLVTDVYKRQQLPDGKLPAGLSVPLSLIHISFSMVGFSSWICSIDTLCIFEIE